MSPIDCNVDVASDGCVVMTIKQEGKSMSITIPHPDPAEDLGWCLVRAARRARKEKGMVATSRMRSTA